MTSRRANAPDADEVEPAFSASNGHKPVLVVRKMRQIIDSFTPARPELTAREVQRSTGLPATTTTRLLQSLVEEGFLDRRGDGYRPGLLLLSWARTATEGLDLVTVAGPVLSELRDQTGESACLFVRHGSHHTCIAVEQTQHAVIQILRVGQVLPLHAGSAGRVFLTYDDSAVADLLGQTELPAFTANTKTGPQQFKEALEATRRDGYAVSFEERSTGAASLSAPVFDHLGALAAVIGIASPVQRFGPDLVPECAERVVAAAAEISRRLAHSPNGDLS